MNNAKNNDGSMPPPYQNLLLSLLWCPFEGGDMVRTNKSNKGGGEADAQ
jgi:hypothetical protein